MENLLNILFPPKCVFCNTFGSVFCVACLQKCTVINKRMHLSVVPSLAVYCCFEYVDLVRRCIKCAKYSSRQFAALQLLTQHGIDNVSLDYSDFIALPIPLSAQRKRARGFNQAVMIAKIVAASFNLPLYTTTLVRVKDTSVQYQLGRAARYTNLKDAFAVVDVSRLATKKVLLIDDICTSGATFLSAARTLYAAGVCEVQAFALSKKL